MENMVTEMLSKVGKDWLLFLVACIAVVCIGYFGFSLFSMTLKVALLWIFIAFGCCTVLYHLMYPKSPKQRRNNETRRTDAEIQKLYEKKRLATEKLQQLQNNMVQNYKENILLPRESAKKEKEEQAFYQFNPTFRGKGQRLGNEADEDVNLTSEQLMTQINEIYDEILEYNNDDSSSTQDLSNHTSTSCSQCTSHHETCHSCHTNDSSQPKTGAHSDSFSHGTAESCTESLSSNTNENIKKIDEEVMEPFQLEETSLRQRKTVPQNHHDNPNKKVQILDHEPPVGEEKVIILAFRCPNGQTSKRRFRQEDKLEVVLQYISSLGYSTQRFGLFGTFPRTHFADSDKSLAELGITRDTSFIIDVL